MAALSDSEQSIWKLSQRVRELAAERDQLAEKVSNMELEATLNREFPTESAAVDISTLRFLLSNRTAERDQARDQIAAARAFHPQVSDSTGIKYCDTCWHRTGRQMWPCATIRAIGSGE